MSSEDLKAFMMRWGLNDVTLALILGVTPGAVGHWVIGRRGIPETVIRLILWFDEEGVEAMEYFKGLGE